MHKCADCGIPAVIYDDGVPLCLRCSDIRDEAIRQQKLNELKRPDKKGDPGEKLKESLQGEYFPKAS